MDDSLQGQQYRMLEEEEKVPNEHPLKRHSLGLGYYQTNYFSYGVPELGRDELDNNREDLDNHGLVAFSEEKKHSGKKRMPTTMPYNLPGDEVDNIGIADRMQFHQNPRFLEEEKHLSRVHHS